MTAPSEPVDAARAELAAAGAALHAAQMRVMLAQLAVGDADMRARRLKK